MAIVFSTFDDIEEINKQIQIIAGKVAELETKLNELIKELQAERTKLKK